MLLLAFGMFAGMNSLFYNLFPKPIVAVQMLFVICFMSIFSYRRGLFRIDSVYFDEKGFTFYDLFGKIEFCAWESIERAEHYFEAIDHFGRSFSTSNRYHRSHHAADRSIILVFTQSRHVRPEIKEDHIVTTRDRKGRRIFPNARNSFVAWVFTGTEKQKLYECLQKYRPDLVVERHESTI